MDRVALGQVFLREVCFTLSVSFHGYSIFICHKCYVILAMGSVIKLHNLKKLNFPLQVWSVTGIPTYSVNNSGLRLGPNFVCVCV